MAIEVGLVNETTLTVQESDTARHTGGETLQPVLGTPRLIQRIEHTAHMGVYPLLAPGQTMVGTSIYVKHLAATPIGMQVRFRAELVEVDGRRLRFKVEAWDEVEKIAEGEHERFIIDEARFAERIAKKARRG